MGMSHFADVNEHFIRIAIYRYVIYTRRAVIILSLTLMLTMIVLMRGNGIR
jgi:hypothetical protein